MVRDPTVWGTVDFSTLNAVNWNEYHNNPCRSLVEVPGGIEWKIRGILSSVCIYFLEYTELYPQYCWKYLDGKIIAQYYLEEAAKTLKNVCHSFLVNYKFQQLGSVSPVNGYSKILRYSALFFITI